ncbi:MAG TPA: ATP-binding protein [Gammaproteobacteria bacterium]
MSDGRAASDFSGAVLNSLVEEVAIIDRAGTIMQVNDAWTRCAERSCLDCLAVGADLLGALKADAARDRDAAAVLAGVERVLQGALDCFEHEYMRTRRDGPHWFSQRVAPLRIEQGGAVIARFDVTDRKRAEQERERHRYELGRAVRAATLGQLSGALAHELNQPLTAILANAQVGASAVDRPGMPAELAEVAAIFADIVADARRAGQVIQRLRSLLQRHEAKLDVVDLNRIADDALTLSRSELLVRNVRLVKQFARGPLAVRGDAVELQHLLLNLIVNACEAMVATAPAERTLRIATSARGSRARLVIEDNGTGVESGAHDKLFEPFYTTKEHGLGLGLSICRSIVALHGGEIAIAGRSGAGTVVTVELPAVGRPGERPRSSGTFTSDDNGPVAGRGDAARG